MIFSWNSFIKSEWNFLTDIRNNRYVADAYAYLRQMKSSVTYSDLYQNNLLSFSETTKRNTEEAILGKKRLNFDS